MKTLVASLVLLSVTSMAAYPPSAAPLVQSEPEYIQRNAISIGELTQLPDRMILPLFARKVIVVGEMHGSTQPPAFVEGLVKLGGRFGKRVALAVEIPCNERVVFDEFLRAGDMEILRGSRFFSRHLRYGISSEAMATLFARVREVPGLVGIIPFDRAYDSSVEQRDLQMAQNLVTQVRDFAIPPDWVVVLTGNYHSRREPFSYQDGEGHESLMEPMAYHLSRVSGSPFGANDIFSLMNRVESGSAWNCYSESDCGTHVVRPVADNYTTALPHEFYFLEEEGLHDGHNGTIFTRHVTASPPLVP